MYWAAETEAQLQWLRQKRAVDRQTFMRIAAAPAVQRRVQELDDIEAYERAREAGALKRVTASRPRGLQAELADDSRTLGGRVRE